MNDTFDIRFHAPSANWPANPFRFQGKGQLRIEADFVFACGSTHRSFRFPKREEHRLRKADIVNAHTDGADVFFHVLSVSDTAVIGFSTPDAATAKRIVALLPERWTEAYALAHAEREVFHDRIDYWSPSTPVIWTLLAANVAVFILMLLQRYRPGMPWKPTLLGWGSGPGVQFDAMRRAYQLVGWGSNMGPLTLHGQGWRLLTSLFIHGSLLHLAFNMLALWQVGQLTERIFGSARFMALYLIAGITGGVASVLWNPHVNSVGASGAIFGILGGLLAFMRRENSGVPPTVIKDLQSAALPFLLFNLGAGFIYPNTDNAAHIGGLVGGLLAGLVLARSLHVPGNDKR